MITDDCDCGDNCNCDDNPLIDSFFHAIGHAEDFAESIGDLEDKGHNADKALAWAAIAQAWATLAA